MDGAATMVGEVGQTKSPGFWRRATRHGLVIAGGGIVLLLGAAALLGNVLAPHDPNQMNFATLFAPPSLAHLSERTSSAGISSRGYSTGPP